MRNERIPAGDSSEVQLLFPDHVADRGPRFGPLINQIVYDAKTGTGDFTATLTRGVLRYVGGAIAPVALAPPPSPPSPPPPATPPRPLPRPPPQVKSMSSYAKAGEAVFLVGQN